VDYQATHADFLGPNRLIWCPEGLDEARAHLLGDPATLSGSRILEVGCGAGQGSRWVAAHGAHAVGIDLSRQMLAHATAMPNGGRPFLCADARRLPLADGVFDVAFSAFGAVPFVTDPGVIMTEVHRILRPGGRWVFSVSHPIRWAFPDVPGPEGLTARKSYFDRTPYVERDGTGGVAYTESHRTIGDRIRELVDAGFVLDDLVEPEWTPGLETVWGGWSPLRARYLPGTAIFVTHRR
jgi:SAM-dependent methyltransferase